MAILWAVVLFVMLGAEPEDSSERPHLRTLAQGTFSGIQQATNIVVTNSTQWAELWKVHSAREKPVKPAPEVNFEKESVLFVALGQKRSGGFKVEISELRKDAGKTEVLVKTRQPKAGGMQLQAITAPFHIVAVPRIEGSVTFRVEPAAEPPRK